MKVIELPYKPRWYQQEFETAMFGGKKRAFLLYHRRCGKDYGCFGFMVNCAVQGIPGYYPYVLPSYSQGRKVIWEGIDEDGVKYLDSIPKSLIVGRPNKVQMSVQLYNGSIIQIVGSKDYDSLRGTNPRGVVLSEYAWQDRRVWEEVLSPILKKNGGWAVFNTTPYGRNFAWELWESAKANPDLWYTQKLTIDDTKLITPEQIDEERREGKSEELIQQEYYVSFDRGIDGSYYGRFMRVMKHDGRIGSVPLEVYAKVHVAFDLGMRDSTAIIFFQICGQEIHIIDCEECQGESLVYYAKLLKDKGYNYGRFFFPHDVKVRELGTGLSRMDILQELGIPVELVPDLGVLDGIEALRGLMQSRLWIDKTKCVRLIKALENYHKEYDDKNKIYHTRPKHDWSSHFADCARYLALSIPFIKDTGTSSLDDIRRIHDLYG